MDDFNVNNNVNGVNGANNANNEEAAAAQNAENANEAENLFDEENEQKPEQPKKDELTFSKDKNGNNSVSDGKITVSGKKSPSILASILGSFRRSSDEPQPEPKPEPQPEPKPQPKPEPTPVMYGIDPLPEPPTPVYLYGIPDDPPTPEMYGFPPGEEPENPGGGREIPIVKKYGIPEDDPMYPIIDPGHIILLYGIPRGRELPEGFAPDKYAASELPEGYRPVKERGAAYASADAPADDIDLASMSADEQAALYASRIGDLIFGAKNAEDVTKATSAALSEDNINFFAKATSNTPDNITSMSLKTSKGIVSKIGEVAASQIDNLINSGELSDEQKTEYENQKIMIKDFIKERLEALEKQFKENQEKDDDDHGLEVE